MVHGITFTHDLPDWDYCSWECTCGEETGINEIDWSFQLAVIHISSKKEKVRNDL